MIQLKELNPHNYDIGDAVKNNLFELCTKINIIRKAYGQPLTVTSGLRSIALQQKLIATGKSTATKSKHLYGQAADIADTGGELKAWILRNIEMLETAGLWCEDFSKTLSWVHFQTRPPRSGARFFNP